MKTENELPHDVLDAINAHRKIEAIKLLREHRGLGLREAKEIIDNYLHGNPNSLAQSGPRTETGIGRLIVIGLVFAAGYLAYRSLA